MREKSGQHPSKPSAHAPLGDRRREGAPSSRDSLGRRPAARRACVWRRRRALPCRRQEARRLGGGVGRPLVRFGQSRDAGEEPCGAGPARLPPAASGGRRQLRRALRAGDGEHGSSDIDRVGGSRVLFQNGTESWIAQQIMLDPDVFAFCGTECALDYDGGLVQQLKQTGACGTPANGIVARDLPGVGVVLEHRNSAENDCGNATMKSLWRVPIRRGSLGQDPPARALVHRPGHRLHRHLDQRPPGAALARRRLEARHAPGRRGPHPHLDPERRPGRRSTAPMHVPPVRAPAQRRVPQPHVRGDSVVYVDGTTVAKTRAAVEAGARAPPLTEAGGQRASDRGQSARLSSPVATRPTTVGEGPRGAAGKPVQQRTAPGSRRPSSRPPSRPRKPGCGRT